jgi:hypothetical protein
MSLWFMVDISLTMVYTPTDKKKGNIVSMVDVSLTMVYIYILPSGNLT